MYLEQLHSPPFFKIFFQTKTHSTLTSSPSFIPLAPYVYPFPLLYIHHTTRLIPPIFLHIAPAPTSQPPSPTPHPTPHPNPALYPHPKPHPSSLPLFPPPCPTYPATLSSCHVISSCHYVCVILLYTHVILSRANLSWHRVIYITTNLIRIHLDNIYVTTTTKKSS